jgi:hypothetical protein
MTPWSSRSRNQAIPAGAFFSGGFGRGGCGVWTGGDGTGQDPVLMTSSHRRSAMMAMLCSAPAAACTPAPAGLPSDTVAGIAPQETVEGAPIDDGGSARQAGGFRYEGPRPPPAPREERGPAPGSGYFWAPGHHRWNGHEHAWQRGGWYPRREGLEYVAPHWENVYGRWEYLPGSWFRLGT